MKRYSLFIVMTALLVISIAAGSAYLSSGSREAKYHHPMRGGYCIYIASCRGRDGVVGSI